MACRHERGGQTSATASLPPRRAEGDQIGRLLSDAGEKGKQLAANEGKDAEIARLRLGEEEQGRGSAVQGYLAHKLETSGKRRRVAAEAACALEGRLVKVKLVRTPPCRGRPKA